MSKQPNILFLLSDQHSFRCFSHLDPNGRGEPVHTPTLDGLAARSTVFDQTYCQAAVCTASRISMMTGRSPMRSGGWANNSYLKPGIATLPQRFTEAGYDTCLIGKMHLGGNRQFIGFQHRPYGDMTGRHGHQIEPFAEVVDMTTYSQNRWMMPAHVGVTQIPESQLQEQAVVRETLAFLREQRHALPEKPWFLCASFCGPHWPLTAPRRHFERYWPHNITPPKVGATGDATAHPLTQRRMAECQCDQLDADGILRARAGYFACVDYFDEILGDLLCLLERDGLLEETIVVYASDHGELAGEHGLWDKYMWQEASVRTPWMVQLPQQRRGDLPAQRLQTPVSLADLFPTLCGLANIPVPADLDGSDLSNAIRTGQEPDRGPVEVVNCIFPGMHHYVFREGRYKYVCCRDPFPDLLFDLEADPLEQTDLLRQNDSAHAGVIERLRHMIDQHWSFERADAQRALDQEVAAANQLPAAVRQVPPGVSGNLYLMPDGRLVAADTSLYAPVVVSDTPQTDIADWPGAMS